MDAHAVGIGIAGRRPLGRAGVPLSHSRRRSLVRPMPPSVRVDDVSGECIGYGLILLVVQAGYRRARVLDKVMKRLVPRRNSLRAGDIVSRRAPSEIQLVVGSSPVMMAQARGLCMTNSSTKQVLDYVLVLL